MYIQKSNLVTEFRLKRYLIKFKLLDICSMYIQKSNSVTLFRLKHYLNSNQVQASKRSLFHKLSFFNPYICATQCCRPQIFQSINSFELNYLNLKYLNYQTAKIQGQKISVCDNDSIPFTDKCASTVIMNPTRIKVVQGFLRFQPMVWQ